MPDSVEQTPQTEAAPPTAVAPRTRAARVPIVPPVAPSRPVAEYETLMAQLSAHLAEHPEDQERFRSHGIVNGIVGEMADKLAERKQSVLREREALEAAAAAARAKEQELLDLAENDPEAFAERFRTQAQADRALKELKDHENLVEQRIAGQIGLAARDLPELQTLTIPEQRKIADALSGVSSDRVIGVYNTVLIDIAADRRAETRMEREFPTRLAAEVEAKLAETNAARLRTSAAPALGTAARLAASDEPDFRADPMGYLSWIQKGGRDRLTKG